MIQRSTFSLSPLGLLSCALILIFTVGCGSTYTPPPAQNPPPPAAPAPEPAPSTSPPPAPSRDYAVDDRAIHDRVHEALDRAPGIDESDIHVRVDNGNVYLSGHVHTSTERQSAHDVAHSVEGVRHVFIEDLEIL